MDKVNPGQPLPGLHEVRHGRDDVTGPILRRRQRYSQPLHSGINRAQHFLDEIHRFLFEQWFSTLFTHPSGHIVNHQVVSLPIDGVAHFLSYHFAFTVQAFHFYVAHR
jgi:hypothetical protein